MDQNDLIAEQLAEIRTIILEREGEDVQDQFEVDGFLICINIDGSAYEDSEDESKFGLFTLIQIEKGPLGMEELIACALEQYDLENEEAETSHFILCGETSDLSETLDAVREKVYRHWHWLDMPNTLGPEEELPDDDELDP